MNDGVCPRCNFGVLRMEQDHCDGCRLVLKTDRVLELERELIVSKHFADQEISRLKRELKAAMMVVEAARRLRDQIRIEFPVCPDAFYVDPVSEALAAFDTAEKG